MNKALEPGDKVIVCTMRGQWQATVKEICISRSLYGAWGWFEISDCENPKLNGSVFDLNLIEHHGKTAHFNCAKDVLSVAGDLQHHYNCWALVG